MTKKKSFFTAISIAVIVIVTSLAFRPAIRDSFVEWDNNVITSNIPGFRNLGLANLKWMFTSFHAHYRPLYWLSMGITYRFFGMKPSAFHSMSLFFHVLTSIALFFLVLEFFKIIFARSTVPAGKTCNSLQLWGKKYIAAVIAALFFSIHPLRVEPVAWQAAGQDLLSGLFFIAAILFYLKGRSSANKKKRFPAVSFLFFLFAMLSKEMAITLPAVLLLLDFYPLKRIKSGQRFLKNNWGLIKEKIPFFAVSGAWVFIALKASAAGAKTGLAEHGIISRVCVTAYGLISYLIKTLIPANLMPFYPLPSGITPFKNGYIFYILAFCLLVFAAVRFVKKAPWLFTALAGYFVILLPVIGVVQYGPQIMADRYTYTAAPVLSVLLGCGLLKLTRGKFKVLTVLFALLFIFLFRISQKQCGIWESDFRIWKHMLEIKPGWPVANYNVAVAYEKEKKFDEALACYEKILRTERKYIFDINRADVCNNIGVIYQKRNDPDSAIDYYGRALEIEKDNVRANVNIGDLFFEKGDYEKAAEHFERALLTEKEDKKYIVRKLSNALLYLGKALMDAGGSGRAVEAFNRILKTDSDNLYALYNLAVVMTYMGDNVKAAEYLNRALTINPGFQPAKKALSSLRTPKK
ncbi:MAG: tetratricopeptide repeat protein [bacterium]